MRPGEQAPSEQLDFRLGPFQVSPYFVVGSIGIDTNVFLTQDDRQTDLVADGGPGFRIGLPLGRVEVFVDGYARYYWFARTEVERHFGGRAGGGFVWNAGGFVLGASRFFTRTYDRPSLEVDDRVLRDQWMNRVYLDLQAGARLRLQPGFTFESGEVAQEADYLGTDLSTSLNADVYRAMLDVLYRLTGKTDFVLLSTQEWVRHPVDPSRDVDSTSVLGGFALSSATRLSGRIVAGVRHFRPKDPARRGGSFLRPVGEGSLLWRLGSKTELRANYRYDTRYSAFDTELNQLPVVESQFGGVGLNRRLTRKIDLDASVRASTMSYDVPVIVVNDGVEQAIVRDDIGYEARLDLGYRIRERLRIAVVATYSERRSNFSDLGVDGLLLGASIRFNP